MSYTKLQLELRSSRTEDSMSIVTLEPQEEANKLTLFSLQVGKDIVNATLTKQEAFDLMILLEMASRNLDDSDS